MTFVTRAAFLLSLTPTGRNATRGTHVTCFCDSSFEASDVDKEIVNSKKARNDKS